MSIVRCDFCNRFELRENYDKRKTNRAEVISGDISIDDFNTGWEDTEKVDQHGKIEKCACGAYVCYNHSERFDLREYSGNNPQSHGKRYASLWTCKKCGKNIIDDPVRFMNLVAKLASNNDVDNFDAPT